METKKKTKPHQFKKGKKKSFSLKAAEKEKREYSYRPKGTRSNGPNDLRVMSKKLNADPFPQKFNTVMTYASTDLLTAGEYGLVGAELIYNLNSVYDPDFVSVGHQPLYRDQIATLYNRYVVRGCKAEIIFTDPNADGIFAVIAAGYNSTVGLTLQTISERPMAKTLFINNTASQKDQHIEYFKPWEVMGISKKAYNNDLSNTSAAINANPTALAYLRIALGCVNASHSGSQINCITKLTYYVTFYDRVIPNPS